MVLAKMRWGGGCPWDTLTLAGCAPFAAHPAITRSELTVEILGQDVKYILC